MVCFPQPTASFRPPWAEVRLNISTLPKVGRTEGPTEKLGDLLVNVTDFHRSVADAAIPRSLDNICVCFHTWEGGEERKGKKEG